MSIKNTHLVFSLLGLVWSCQEPVAPPIINQAPITIKVYIGEVDTSLSISSGGAPTKGRAIRLSKSAEEREDTIQLDSLQIRLALRDGTDTISTTLDVAGLKNRQVVWSCLDSIPPRSWMLSVRSFSSGEIIHNGVGILRSSPEGVTVEVKLVITVRVVTEEISVAD